MKLKKTAIFLSLLLPLFPLGAVSAHEHEPSGAVSKDSERDKKELEYDLRTNSAFLQSARAVVESSDDIDAMSYLKLAEAALLEGIKRYNDGEYNLASEHIKESTRMAIQAIITAKNEQDLTIRDYAIQEEMVLKEKHETAHKVEQIKKDIPEVAIFIATSERLLSTDENVKAREQVNAAKKLLESAKEDFSNARYDESIENLDKAYKLITDTIKEMKRLKGEAITYPKRKFRNEKEELDYELKKNNSYLFFATQSVSEDDKYAEGMIRDGEALKDEAMAAIKDGENRKAIEKLKASTAMLMQAVRTSFKTRQERD